MAFDWGIWTKKVLVQLTIVGIPVILTLIGEIPQEQAGIYVTVIAALLVALENWLKHKDDL